MKFWLQDEMSRHQAAPDQNNLEGRWLRMYHPKGEEFFEKIANGHIVVLLFVIYLVLMFVLNFIA